MGEQRFFLKDIDPSAKEIIFPRDISHQIKHVLRYQPGEQVTVLDGDGKAYQVEINALDDIGVKAHVIMAGEGRNRISIHISLYFPLSRREKVEWILQKGTEVGVSAFHPFISSRSLVQSIKVEAKKITRWETIIREAAEQSGRAVLPKLHQPKKLTTVIPDEIQLAQYDLALVASVSERKFGLRQALALVKDKRNPRLALFVGAEGGYSDQELVEFENTGIHSVSLGMHVLRMETAAIIFPALVISHLTDIND